ncbi:hypothetical protein MBLNU230_g5565t1 [Neophaeotheca triangularis]
MPPTRRSARTNTPSQSPYPAPPISTNHSPTSTNRTSTPSISTSKAPTTSSASVSRAPTASSTSNTSKTGLRLTVKAPPSKLRQATSGADIPPPPSSRNNTRQAKNGGIPPNPYASTTSYPKSSTTRTSRTTRNPRAVVDPDSDDIDAMAEDEDDEVGDIDDSDRDVSMRDAGSEDEGVAGHPPPPVIKEIPQAAGNTAKPNLIVTAPPNEGTLKGVERKEIATAKNNASTSDEDLSELSDEQNESSSSSSEDAEGEDEDEDETTLNQSVLTTAPTADEEDDLSSSDIDISASAPASPSSRSQTPDLSKLTRRQRLAYTSHSPAPSSNQTLDPDLPPNPIATSSTGLMSLSNEAQKKKILSQEEHAMRRAEMARRRKNLSEARLEEEKVGTINKLLQRKPVGKEALKAESKKAAKSKGRKSGLAREILANGEGEGGVGAGLEGDEGEDGDEDAGIEAVDPGFVRWVHSARGSRLGVPAEWLEDGRPVGDVFRGGRDVGGNGKVDEIAGAGVGEGKARLVEEVA